MAALQMRRQFWQCFLMLVMIFFSPFRFFLSMWYQSNLKFNNGTLPVSKLNAIRPVTLTYNSVTDKYFTAIWNRSLFHIVLSFFLICFSWIEFLRLIRLFDWFVLLSSHLKYSIIYFPLCNFSVSIPRWYAVLFLKLLSSLRFCYSVKFLWLDFS